MDPLSSFDSSDEFCAVCGKSVAGGRGYAHLRHDGRVLALCCPLCLEAFQQKPGYYAALRKASESGVDGGA